jgi:hypothetical protein
VVKIMRNWNCPILTGNSSKKNCGCSTAKLAGQFFFG